ncbi:MAG: hypothetical protein NT023_10200 [Armatimonadetes bacterium]|nr:hypothetical protein [Armatimonadota bacterium]
MKHRTIHMITEIALELAVKQPALKVAFCVVVCAWLWHSKRR